MKNPITLTVSPLLTLALHLHEKLESLFEEGFPASLPQTSEVSQTSESLTFGPSNPGLPVLAGLAVLTPQESLAI